MPNELVYVIGDTPLDIDAAHAAGCTGIGVATGRYDRRALLQAGADQVMESFEEDMPLR
jgi:phosphoglycolate phosphatase-like HAD superfamily hydrolase